VLYVTDIYGGHHGGSEGQLVSLAGHLPAPWKPRLWVLQKSPWLFTDGFPAPVTKLRLGHVKRPTTWLRIAALAQRVRREKIDLIHTYHSDASLWMPYVGLLAGVPVIVSRRDLGFWQTPSKAQLLRASGRFVDLVIANAQAVKRQTVAAEHVPPARVEVVPNGHDPARFDAPPDSTLRTRLGLPDGARLVGLVANLKPLKRQHDLIDAFQLLGGRFTDVHALLVGTGTEAEREALLERAHEAGLAGRVHVLGVKGDVVPILKHLEVGVLCSETEGLSNSILEYLGAGLPVIATQVGGNPELVREGENGFLVAVGKPPALAERLGQVLGDAALRRRLGEGARRSFDARYRLERMVGETVACYERVLAEREAARTRTRSAVRDALTVTALTDAQAVRALEPEWRGLGRPWRFFAGPTWTLAWLDWAGADAKPVVLAVRDGAGRLVGVAPFAHEPGGRLGFVGRALGADHLDVAARPEDGLAVARAVLSWWRASGHGPLALGHLAEDAWLRLVLREPAWRRAHSERAASTAPWIDTHGTFDAWLARTFDRKQRHEFRRLAKRVRESEQASIERAAAPSQAAAAIETLMTLHARRFAAQGRSTVFQGASIAAFHRGLCERLLALPADGPEGVWLPILHDAGRPLAAFYAFRFHGVMHHFQSGIEPEARAQGPGTVLRTIGLEEDVFGRGLEAYDFMDGDEAYKDDWTDLRHVLFDVVVDRPTPLGRARALVRTTEGFARRAAKSLLRRP
jgi:glycosyltransferase involved in cell wall biosynthesis/CelD/BcsL family acetyltransferase involved in cellulose biosynthesis